MANHELFYRVAREALTDYPIHELIADLDAAIESYLNGRDEDGELMRRDVREDIERGHMRSLEFSGNLRAWELSVR